MGFSITDTAAYQVKRFIEDSGGDTNTKLRVGVTGGGCSGFNYSLELSEEPVDDENDTSSQQYGITIVVDKKSNIFLEDVTLDYINELDGTGFSFINPNARSCGCGKSFNPD